MKRIVLVSLVVFGLLVGCAGINPQPNPIMMDKGVFQSAVEPGFTLDVGGDEYLGVLDYHKRDTDHMVDAYTYYFMNKDGGYVYVVKLISVGIGEWNQYKPWKWDRGAVMCGREFDTGVNLFRLVMTKVERATLPTLAPYDGNVVTSNIWVYTPGRRGGGVRIVIRYFEKGSHTDPIDEFVARAKNRVRFHLN